MNKLEQAWYRKAWWLVLLSPLSLLFEFFSRTRRNRYRKGKSKVIKAPVPVIVVGNISVGGTGKTPVVISLVKSLQKLGLRPGVVSRGYGASSARYPQWVTPTTPTQKSGDEALLIARHTRVPVVIDPNRPAAIQALLSSKECDIIISDDGLQHYAMARNIEIVVIDGSRGLANQRLLPAGPLREKPERMRTADFVMVTGEAQSGLLARLRTYNNRIYCSQLQALGIINIQSGESVPFKDFDREGRLHAVAGIGNPQRFFDMLTAAGFNIITHEFPDHHDYTPEDLEFEDDLPILMTEKDAVKCQAFAKPRHWFVQVAAVLPDGLPLALIQRLQKSSIGDHA